MLELEHIAWDTPEGENIIHAISLNIAEGRLAVIPGPNGGGKTPTAKLIAGLITPASGKIYFDGQDITDMDITARANAGIAYAFQQPVRFKGLSVRDILELSAGRELNEGELCGLLGKVGLCANDYIDRELNAGLSGGEMKRIEIATVLARDAKLSVFDEPEAGIDLWSFSKLVEAFKEIQKEKRGTLLIISHQERILEIADEIIVVAKGRVRAAGAREEILPSLLKDEMSNMCPLDKG